MAPLLNINYFRYKLIKPFKSWRNKYLKRLAKREAKQLDLYHRAAQEVSEYTGEPIEVVQQKHKTLGPQIENNFGIFLNQKNLAEQSVRDFYRDCSYYIYELPLWNAETNRPRYLNLICLPCLRRNGYQKVMDFGAGAGDLCIELANAGLETSYCDIGEQLFKFAQWRFQRRGLPITMIRGLERLGGEQYDCIFSFDAFEHVKGLPETLKELVRHIKIGGSLIFSGAFSGGTLHLEENEPYNDFKNLDRLMRGCGLSFQDKFAQFYFYKKTAG